MPRDLDASRDTSVQKVHESPAITPPEHWVTRSDGIWLYEGDKHVKTITFDMLKNGLFEACAKYYGEQVRRG